MDLADLQVYHGKDEVFYKKVTLCKNKFLMSNGGFQDKKNNLSMTFHEFHIFTQSTGLEKVCISL